MSLGYTALEKLFGEPPVPLAGRSECQGCLFASMPVRRVRYKPLVHVPAQQALDLMQFSRNKGKTTRFIERYRPDRRTRSASRAQNDLSFFYLIMPSFSTIKKTEGRDFSFEISSQHDQVLSGNQHRPSADASRPVGSNRRDSTLLSFLIDLFYRWRSLLSLII